jgi:peptidoglycan/LPS O-acetylase OafA/YrhL
VISHSFELMGKREFAVICGQVGLGDLGVTGFFGVSGYLLFSSAKRLNSKNYFIHRFARIFPAFWVTLMFTSFILNPIINLIVTDKVSIDWSGLNGNITYVLKNFTTVIFQHQIGSSPVDIASHKAINGSLWTLAPEICCYLFLWGVVHFFKRHATSIFFGIMLLTISLQTIYHYSEELTLNQRILSSNTLLCAFSTGALLGSVQKGKWIQERTFSIALCALLSCVALVSTKNWFFAGQIFWVIAVLVIAMRPCTWRFVEWLQRNDYSYGIYLLHYPMILVAATYIEAKDLNGSEKAAFLSTTYLALLLFAALMWVGLESKILAIVKRKTFSSGPI